MKPVAYHRLDASELIESAEFYERRNPTLGEVFVSTVEATLPRIQRQPGLGKPGKFETRSWKTKRFPFRIVYLEQSERIWIVAVAHLSRRPDYWMRRLR
jgi:plasmid stabilization system protein ParE